ncbi:MAG: ABC transporter ATP-binding protein [Bacillota bacterium]|nr:ABC transporter ATP-binding protein [Bacillota bacterium]
MRTILKYISKYKLLIVIPFMAMLISTAIDMFNPYLTQLLVDKVIVNKEYGLLSYIVISIGSIGIARALLGYVKEFTFDYMASKVAANLKLDLFNHIQSLSFNYFDGQNTGELMSRIGEDVENIWKAAGFGASLFVEQTIYFITASVILLCLDWKLAILSLATMPFLCYVTMKLEKEIGIAFGKISDQTAALNTTAQENIAGVRLVKAFAREKHEILKFLKLNKTNYTLNLEQNKVWGKYNPMQELLGNISILIVITFGGMFVIKDYISLGTLVAFNGYLWMLIWPMRMIGWLTNILAQSSASAKKLDNIFNTKPSIESPKDAFKLDEIHGHIKFENVSFKYNNELILRNINLEASPGDTIAIMGTTGSGKTSLVNLIGRYYDACDGRILIDGLELKSLDLNSLRSKMAVVPQDNFLFSDTIEQNIRFGKEDATFEEIEAACRTACASEFIDKLEEKYETIIGERGIGLSGGQKQRLAIARALVRNSSILILDDATSALDMNTEYSLLKNLFNNKKKSTTFIIAHRISAVKNADEIILLDDGSIIERGTHSELLNKKGKYYDIYCEQFKDLENDESEVV